MKHYGVTKESVLIESTGVIGHRIKKVLIDKLTSLVDLHWQLILCDFLKKIKLPGRVGRTYIESDLEILLVVPGFNL